MSLETLDKYGNLADVTLGYDHPSKYLTEDNPYVGATIGRFANRIDNASFTLDGTQYNLTANNDHNGSPSHLHGGLYGFHRVCWDAQHDYKKNAVILTHESKDGEEGYPGNIKVKVIYTLNEENELHWEAEATTDAPTIINLVHHTYWNLSGNPETTIDDHILTLDADYYLPTNSEMIPTGEIHPVANTPMDFISPTPIGDRINDPFSALEIGNGYDHCWRLNSGDKLAIAARLQHPDSGRIMEVHSNQPAIQFYSGNKLDGSIQGRENISYSQRAGLCLETENFPDAPNQPNFPNAVLRPGEIYRHIMIHKFSAE